MFTSHLHTLLSCSFFQLLKATLAPLPSGQNNLGSLILIHPNTTDLHWATHINSHGNRPRGWVSLYSFDSPNQRTSFLWGLYNFDEKKRKNSTGTSSTERTFHMLSQSLESCCIIAFNVAGNAIEISQRLLSQMWVRVKVIVDTSLSLIKLSITSTIRTLGSAGQHMLVMWGDGGGEGRRASTERQMDRVGQLKMPLPSLPLQWIFIQLCAVGPQQICHRCVCVFPFLV